MKILSFQKKINSCLFLIALAPLADSCANQANQNTSTNTQAKIIGKDSLQKNNTGSKKDSVNIPHERKYNDIARYIAGMKALPGSPYAKMESDSVWIKFHKTFDTAWKELTIKRLHPMAEWAATELATEQKSNCDIFYPLSGPDILHVSTFFPNAKQYHLYALERNGALPDLDLMKKKQLENYLTDVYSSLGDVFTKSYFITKKMMTALTADNVNGTLPLICVFLVRTGHEIVNVQYFHLNDDGTETALDKDSLGTHHNDFVKVYFKNNNDGSLQTVTYMRCNIQNDNYAKNLALQSLFAKMPPSITYLKSASYILHYKTFTSFKDVILNKSVVILEDDTGIPYKYLTKDKWDVTLYGVYEKPVKDFSGVFQEDLLNAYQDTINKPRKLPFSLGYHWGSNKQNLIKAELRSAVK
jgi:hypothetical protein